MLWGVGCAPGLLSQLIKAPEQGQSAGRERRGEVWGCLRLVTVGEGKVRRVSAEGVSYRVREGKGQGDRKILLKGEEGWASWAQAWGSH